jgi:branched-chain amino acid transport system substrate-binding protein
VLVLNHYGGNMVNSLTNAVQFGLRDRAGQRQELRDRRAALLPPDGEGCRRQREGHLRLDQLALVAAGRRLEGLREVLRHQSTASRRQAAHTCYVQTLLYADAVQRAGSFNPCAVVEALEGFEFDGMGNGPTLYRAEDHQCFKDVLVVKGKENPTSSSTFSKSSKSPR